MSYDGSQNFHGNDTTRPWAVYYKQAKNNAEDINDSLLKHIELLDKENVNKSFSIH
jgi:hypothetical protein